MNKSSTKYVSSQQEQKLAKSLGGNVVQGSGGGKWHKGDVNIDQGWLVEAKTVMTTKKSYSIKKEVIDKIRRQSFEMQKDNWALAFNFGPGEKNYIVISEDTFKELLEYQNEAMNKESSDEQ